MQLDTLDCFVALMTAQAMECSWRKGRSSGSIKESLLARIGIEISNLYKISRDAVHGTQAAAMPGMVVRIIL
jgi:hypothetical protein